MIWLDLDPADAAPLGDPLFDMREDGLIFGWLREQYRPQEEVLARRRFGGEDASNRILPAEFIAWAETTGRPFPVEWAEAVKPQAKRRVDPAPVKRNPRGGVSRWKPVFLPEIERRVREREIVFKEDNAGQIDGIVHIARELVAWCADKFPDEKAPNQKTVQTYLRAHFKKNKQ